MWLSKLLGYDFNIIYKHGSFNRAADALSRRGEEEGELNGLIKPCWMNAEKIDEEVRKDPYLSKVVKNLKQNSNSHKHYTLRQG